ncbi:hypothetical protein ACQPZJ_01900 [Actinoplanes sp. CA-054009]
MTNEMPWGRKRYRIRAYDDRYEVLADKIHIEWLDLDDYDGFKEARPILEGLRLTLAVLVGVREDDMDKFRLSVHTWPEGTYVMDWVAR